MGQGVSDDTIKIGVTLDQSGPFALFAPSAKAALDAKFSFINDKTLSAASEYATHRSPSAQGEHSVILTSHR